MKRRTLLQTGSLVLTLGLADLARGSTILTVRVWPAPEYSRVTIESDGALSAKPLFVPSPPRLAVDIEGITLNPALKELVAKVRADDPNIAGIRVGQFAPNVVRLVIDLKLPIRPQVFALTPVAAYQHRLVLDLYPVQEADPLEALIAQRMQDSSRSHVPTDPLGDLIVQHAQKPGDQKAASAPQNATQSIATSQGSTRASEQIVSRTLTKAESPSPSATDRLIIVALDPGHGGEIGRASCRERV